MPSRVGLFIDTSSIGGAEVIVAELAQAISESGHRPVLLHFGNAPLLETASEAGLESHFVRGLKDYKSMIRVPIFTYRFARQLRDLKLDVLHSHLFGPIVGGAAAARFSGTTHVGTLHDTYVVEERISRARLLRLTAALGTKLVTVSEAMTDFYSRVTGMPESRFQTIPNGVKPNTPMRSRAAIRTELGIPDHQCVLVMVARLVPLKRHDLLLDAISGLPQEVSPRVTVLMVGDGPSQGEIERLCRRDHGLHDVRLLGFRTDVGDILNAADVFVLPSDSEGMSRSILEAMAAGLPCIASDAGANPELVREGVNGLTFPTGDAAALRRCLQCLLEDPAERARMGHQSLRIVEEGYSHQGMIDRYLGLYGLQ
ncbi:glycosyltransferase family 4 protein [Wenzhouxiangella sp. XN24]|uniref:glycosyltransferase family 4 protein n=1 Tax=Wenzhouxiangella sp. XN24 TaxID=2713569 RepID=UPI0013EE09D2|nr:glycosyltransferase family 4 protein [Wenzhouxiangella sp. XN24]NGX16876.1 glycosyltransferase family 4 protein [Wenzhouxiangella sp. XN24]